VQELVLEAYETGKLIALIPFAAKVLEACTKSKIFAPPNVWVMAIMRLFAEIYQIPELKLNLKFEIELLCNHMGLDLNGTLSLCVCRVCRVCVRQQPADHLYPSSTEIKPTEALKDKLRPDSQDFTAPPPAAALAPGTFWKTTRPHLSSLLTPNVVSMQHQLLLPLPRSRLRMSLWSPASRPSRLPASRLLWPSSLSSRLSERRFSSRPRRPRCRPGPRACGRSTRTFRSSASSRTSSDASPWPSTRPSRRF